MAADMVGDKVEGLRVDDRLSEHTTGLTTALRTDFCVLYVTARQLDVDRVSVGNERHVM
jgi:hypothetical protein